MGKAGEEVGTEHGKSVLWGRHSMAMSDTWMLGNVGLSMSILRPGTASSQSCVL